MSPVALLYVCTSLHCYTTYTLRLMLTTDFPFDLTSYSLIPLEIRAL